MDCGESSQVDSRRARAAAIDRQYGTNERTTLNIIYVQDAEEYAQWINTQNAPLSLDKYSAGALFAMS